MPRKFLKPEQDRFRTMKEKYGIWPTTVWECNHQDQVMQAIKREIGDRGSVRKGLKEGHYLRQPTLGTKRKTDHGSSARVGCFTKPTDDKSIYRGMVTASVFNPLIAQIILNCYAPKEGVCFDPFGGGGTRAILAAKNGLVYKGVELRQEEVDAVNKRCKYCGVTDQVTIFRGDACDCTAFMEDCSADFCYTCPSYYDLEKYEGGDGDLSMLPTYNRFLGELEKAIKETYRILKPDSFSCWVVGLHRDKDGELIALNHDVAWLHQDNGFRFKEEIVLVHKGSGAIRRVGNFEKGDRRMIRMHEYVLVFTRL